MKFFLLFILSCTTEKERALQNESKNELIAQEQNFSEREISSSAFDPENLAATNLYSQAKPSWDVSLTYDLSTFSFSDGSYGLWLNTAGPVTPPKATDLRVRIICANKTCRQNYTNAFVAIEQNSLPSTDQTRVAVVNFDFKKKIAHLTFSQSLKNHFLATAPGKRFSLSFRLYRFPENKVTQRQIASTSTSSRPLVPVFFQAQTFSVPNILTPVK